MKKFFLFIVALCAVNAMATEGALSGKFSVSATKQVHFSKGNLQYDTVNAVWGFAANQYDIIGKANMNGSQLGEVIDLFGFGTGDAPTKYTYNDEDYAEFHEWGANPISNGGNAADLWRTLTKDEWAYLFRSRTNAASLIGYALIGGRHGLVLLPDNWTLPEGASFYSITEKGLAWDDNWGSGAYLDENGGHLNDNDYTTEQWTQLETAGAVFLPLAGFRMYQGSTTRLEQINEIGFYRSSTAGNYVVVFQDEAIFPPYDNAIISRGGSVRLVHDYSPSTGIDDVQDNVQCTKEIRDGQLLILRGDKTYTVSGQEVK